MTLQENYKIKQAYLDMLNESTVGEHALRDISKPAVWIGTYGNYNDGNLYGEGEASGWIDLTTFDSGDEFRSWLTEQARGKDVEWMFQDYQGFPRDFYGESYIKDKLWDYLEFIKDSNQYGLNEKQLDAVIEHLGWERAKEALDDGYVHPYPECRTFGEVAQEIISELGEEAFSDSAYEDAFDYEKFGRECSWDWSESEHDGKTIYEEYGVGEDDDKALGEAIVDMYGDISELGKETIMRYVDYDNLGRDLRYDGTWIDVDGGMIQIDDF